MQKIREVFLPPNEKFESIEPVTARSAARSDGHRSEISAISEDSQQYNTPPESLGENPNLMINYENSYSESLKDESLSDQREDIEEDKQRFYSPNESFDSASGSRFKSLTTDLWKLNPLWHL